MIKYRVHCNSPVNFFLSEIFKDFAARGSNSTVIELHTNRNQPPVRLSVRRLLPRDQKGASRPKRRPVMTRKS